METTMTTERAASPRLRDPRNKGRLIGQKRPLKPKDVWTIRVRLQMERRRRDLAMFNLAIDSKLRGCDLMRLRIDDVFVGERVRDRATVIQKTTGRPVQLEITEQTRRAMASGLPISAPAGAPIYSRAASRSGRTSRRGSRRVKRGPLNGHNPTGSAIPISAKFQH
jgi:integrase